MDTNVTSEHLPRGWHKTFYTLWIGSFITGMGYSMTMPFISCSSTNWDISPACSSTFIPDSPLR